MSAPLVSILMPMRNAAPWIEQCIQSIQDQELTEWELIIVNDHSTDSSLQLAELMAIGDNRIIVLNNKGIGIISALQLAHKQARGKYVSRMDADDLMPKGKLKLFYEALQTTDGELVTGKVRYFTDDNTAVSSGYIKYENWLNERIDKQDHWNWIYRECVVASANWMATKDLFFCDHLTYPEDYDLVFKWYAKRVKIVTIDAVTHLWREHPMRTSRISEHYNQAHFFKLKLSRFLSIDYNQNKQLVIVGNQKKAKIAEHHFNDCGIEYLRIDKSNTDAIPYSNKSQVLVTVFPDKKERLLIQNLLNKRGFIHGENFWWL